ncbi:MAG: hypothetical protein ABFS32_03585 [Bacteroidota bacterium]
MKLLRLILILSFTGITYSNAQNLGNVLKEYNATLNVRFNQYDKERYNLLVDRTIVPFSDNSVDVDFQGSNWEVSKKVSNLKDGRLFEVEIKFECIEGLLNNASLSCDIKIDNWSKDNYVLLPGAVYNGNRYPTVQMNYPPFFIDPYQVGLNKPLLLSDQPRLNYKAGYSRIQERSGSMSFPSIAFKGESDKGFWMFFKQGNELGDYGIDIEETANQKKAVISLTSPLVREKEMCYSFRMDAKPSTDKPATFMKGDVITMKFNVDFFHCPKIQTLYDRMVEIREEYYPEQSKQKLIPFSKAFELQERKFNNENWKKEGYYSVGTYDQYSQDWQIGWTGGMITTLPLLMNGIEETRERVKKNFDWLAKNGVSPSGYYYGTIYKGQSKGDFPHKALGDSIMLTRKNSDAVYYIFKQFDLMKKYNITINPEWEDANYTALEAQIGTWKRYNQLGQFVNQETGELYIGNTTSAGIFPAALCAAYRYTGEDRYLKFAEQIAEYYYTNFIQKGLTCGGPGDAVQSFDSESSYGLLVSIVELFETTQKDLWLERAIEMAHQFASWVVAYDYVFSDSTLFHKMNIQSSGGVYANTQNKTAPGGICTHSGIALLKLYRATQNSRYVKLLQQITQSQQQYMTWGTHRFPNANDGWISERCNMTDFHPAIGETFPYSGWSETSLLLAATELPSIYVNLDKLKVYCFDHLEAEIQKNGKNKYVLRIENTTSYDASIKILAETQEEAKNPLFHNESIKWKKVTVKTGEVIYLPLSEI